MRLTCSTYTVPADWLTGEGNMLRRFCILLGLELLLATPRVLGNALIGRLRRAFGAWTRGGYWRKREPKKAPVPPQLPPSGAGPGSDV